MTLSKRWLRVAAAFSSTFLFALFVFLVVPVVTAVLRSGGPAWHQSLQVIGLHVFTVTTDGKGGFGSAFGAGSLLLPLALGALVGGAAVITALLYSFTAGNHAIAGKAIFGAVLIVVILFMPQGILGWFFRRRPEKSPEPQVPRGAAPRESTAQPHWRRAASTERIFVARGLRKRFHGVQALDGVDIEIRRGEILGLLGPNGSGKSTFINLVSGHYRPDAGEILFEGRDLAKCPTHRIARGGIARTYQIPRPFANLTVRENVTVAAMFGNANLSRKAAECDSQKWLDFTGLAHRAEVRPDELNLHQRKFLELARALASRPRVVLLDEVLSGLTPTEIDEAVELIHAIRDQGATIVFVEHVMRAVMALTDRIVVLNHGLVIAEGSAVEVMARPEVITAYLGRPHA